MKDQRRETDKRNKLHSTTRQKQQKEELKILKRREVKLHDKKKKQKAITSEYLQEYKRIHPGNIETSTIINEDTRKSKKIIDRIA
jgi:hypothetical protein